MASSSVRNLSIFSMPLFLLLLIYLLVMVATTWVKYVTCNVNRMATFAEILTLLLLDKRDQMLLSTILLLLHTVLK